MVYTSIYTYILCTYSVHAAMYFVHNHTSLQIRSYQPCNTGCSWSITAYSTQAPTVVSCIHILMKSVFRVQLGIYKYIHVYTMYIQCTHAAMYFVHNHTSLQIRSYQPCDAGESQLRAADGAVKARCSLSWCLPRNPVVIQVKSVYTYICNHCTVYR